MIPGDAVGRDILGSVAVAGAALAGPAMGDIGGDGGSVGATEAWAGRGAGPGEGPASNGLGSVPLMKYSRIAPLSSEETGRPVM